MIKNIFGKQILTWMFCAVAVLLLGACQSGPGATETIQPTALPSQTELTYEEMLTHTAPTPSPSPSGGLTFEEMRSHFPPAPVDFQLTLLKDGIRLDWTPAPAVTTAHDYSDKVAYYNIYRKTSSETDLILIATTSNTFYNDKTVLKGTTYTYAVSAVHEGPLEGERTNPATMIFQ
jgi:hypothetical protein